MTRFSFYPSTEWIPTASSSFDLVTSFGENDDGGVMSSPISDDAVLVSVWIFGVALSFSFSMGFSFCSESCKWSRCSKEWLALFPCEWLLLLCTTTGVDNIWSDVLGATSGRCIDSRSLFSTGIRRFSIGFLRLYRFELWRAVIHGNPSLRSVSYDSLIRFLDDNHVHEE